MFFPVSCEPSARKGSIIRGPCDHRPANSLRAHFLPPSPPKKMSGSSQSSSLRNRGSRHNRRTRIQDTTDRDSFETVPQRPASYLEDIRPRRERTRQDDYLYYSIAGPPAPPPRYHQHQTHFDSGYLELNPWMQQEDDGLNFTLARNFPRTVRWKREGRHKRIKPDEKGESEMATPGQGGGGLRRGC